MIIDEYNQQARTMKNEMEEMNLNRIKNLAEIEQLHFFEQESLSMITNLQMNHQSLLEKREAEDIQLRKIRQENSHLRKELEKQRENVNKEQNHVQKKELDTKEALQDPLVQKEVRMHHGNTNILQFS